MAVAAERPGFGLRRGLVAYLLLVPGIAWLLVFYAWPTIQMFFISLQEGSLERGYQLTWHWATYGDVFSKYSTQLIRSVGYGLIVTVACLLISYPLAYFIAIYGGRWKNALLFMVILPFFVSFLIRTLSWKFILADNGLFLGTIKQIGLLPDDFRLLATPIAVISGLIYNFLPFMALPLYASLEKLDRSLLEAAQDLYSSRAVAFLKVTLPLSLPGVFAGSLLTFIPAMGDFINPALLGGPNTTLIANVIQRRMLISNDYPEGAAISFILMAAILVGVAVYAKLLGTEELTG
ncbi:MAG TPA: ABC transporter permease [Actinomycetota bacterium]|nr:ABC transporter permease [Actinomycetota bacterium]